MYFHVKIEKFEGPLDLLLRLIEEQKLDICRVNIARVADEYLEYIRNQDNISLENLADFVSVASKIVLIKSQSLLPTLEITAAEEKEITDLEEQLARYKIFKEAAGKIKFLFSDRLPLFSRDYFMGVPIQFLPPEKINAFDLKKTLEKIITDIAEPGILPKEKVGEIITLEQKIIELEMRLKKGIELYFTDIKNRAVDKVEIIVSFLAILELIKQRVVQIEQSQPFEEIIIKKHHE